MIKILTLAKGQVITRNNLISILNSARSSYSYAKFNMNNNIYITITFHRDNTIDIATNTRDYRVWNEIQSIRRSYSQARLADYIFGWINILNK